MANTKLDRSHVKDPEICRQRRILEDREKHCATFGDLNSPNATACHVLSTKMHRERLSLSRMLDFPTINCPSCSVSLLLLPLVHDSNIEVFQ